MNETDNAPATRGGEVIYAKISDLIVDARLQARTKLCERKVAQYKRRRLHGDECPPLLIALVQGRPFIVDGFHRRAAYLQAGDTDIPVDVVPMTRAEALMRAGCANHNHGKSLTPQEAARARRMAIAGYIQARRHLTGGQSPSKRPKKTLDEAVNELRVMGCDVSKSGLRSILQKHHPKVYEAHFADPGTETGGLRALKDERCPLEEVRLALLEVRAKGLAVTAENGKQEVVQELERLISDLGRSPRFEPIIPDF